MLPTGSSFGAVVSAAGDMNADGYADALVSVPAFGPYLGIPERAFAFQGSSQGLMPVPLWLAEPDRADTRYGQALGGAGDLNGDGFDDVLVGAPTYSVSGSKEGRAYLYHGFATPAASGGLRNGAGINPFCFSSEPALIGQPWDSSIDNSAHPGASLALLLVRSRGSAGLFLSGGELLLDLSSARLLVGQAPATGATSAFSFDVPPNVGLAGLSASAQGALVGSGYVLCNAYDFVLGF